MIQTSIQYFFNIFFNLINTVRFNLINTVRLTFLIIFFKLNNYSLQINCIGNKVLIFFLFFLIIFYILSTLYLTYLIIKRKVQTNKIKYESIIKNSEFIKNKIKSSLIPVKFTSHQIRNFSTSAFNCNNIESDPELKANRLELAKNKPEDKIKTLKAFKKAYGGGFLGYTHIYNFGNINQFTSYSSQLELETCLSSLESKLIDYVSIIPETET